MTTPLPAASIRVSSHNAASMIGIDRTNPYQLISAGEVEAVKLGKSTRMPPATMISSGNSADRHKLALP
ncbi:MAG: hypothetical protein R3260_13405 [Pseudomonas sp.]|nr:hypothetical protein [Pseudomonas sp.]